jgi:hypothetical protein
MEILKCNAEYDKIYYVVYQNTLRQCKFIQTKGTAHTIPMYVLNIAQIGIVSIQAPRQSQFNSWYHSSKIPSILYESVEDYRKNKPIIDEYGSMSNAYNGKFINSLLKYYQACNCGGLTYTWKWNGYKAVKHIANLRNVEWFWDNNGFQCPLNEQIDCYKTEQDCIKHNQIQIVTF